MCGAPDLGRLGLSTRSRAKLPSGAKPSSGNDGFTGIVNPWRERPQVGRVDRRNAPAFILALQGICGFFRQVGVPTGRYRCWYRLRRSPSGAIFVENEGERARAVSLVYQMSSNSRVNRSSLDSNRKKLTQHVFLL